VTLHLSDRCTLLVPVEASRLPFPASVEVGGVTLVRKTEHHITVFGFDIGRVLGAAIGKAPAIKGAIAELVAAADWSWSLPESPTMVRLHRDKPKDLQTVVVFVDAPGIAAFFGECARVLPDVAGGVALPKWDPPPPHVTLYTSDPAGKDGIGLRRPSDVEAARARGAAGETTGLRAFDVSL
jgi:hypothetical protein